ncbi:MAG: biosynthetic arginine decarboxylase [Planctomycetota bacterium]
MAEQNANTSSPGGEGDRAWTVQDSVDLYGLADWGKGYFSAARDGHVCCRPHGDPERVIDLQEVVEGLADRGVTSPVVLRFDDLLSHRLQELRDAFEQAISQEEFRGKYFCVYPIKVNQQRQLCEHILEQNARLGFGFEVGSKSELLAVLGLTAGYNDMPIVCNGFKDSEFLETVVLATKLGRRIIAVVERTSELQMLVEHAKNYDVRPRIGVRTKLSSQGAGRWGASGGLRSKFGLTISEILSGVGLLREHKMLDCLKMVHCHLGSQIGDIRHFKNAVTELAYIYAELKRLGAGCDTIDVGGGLGVDYDGSQSDSASSANYTIQEYAQDIIYRIKNVCDDAQVDHPTVVSESGRFLVAHSSVLVVDVVGRSRFDTQPEVEKIRAQVMALPLAEQPQPLLDLLDAQARITDKNLEGVYHDALQARDEAMSLFSMGYINLELRAASEQLFWAVGRELVERSKKLGELSGELEELPALLSDIYFCNFSLFQSAPDSWAIGQLFPICPIHRLQEEPTRTVVLADMTCDSDGKIDHFVSSGEEKRILELHDLLPDEPYYLGIFLLGAYQEVLGDLHNLFGDTNVVHLKLDEDGGWEIDEVVAGDTVRQVLGYVNYDPEALTRAIRKDVERAVKRKALNVPESRALLKFYEEGLSGYTYLE